MSHINSFSGLEEKKSFVNKFSNMEHYYRLQDEKKSLYITLGNNGEATTTNRNTMFEKQILGTNRKSRKSIIFSPPPRKSFMLDSRGDLFNSAVDKNKTILKTIDLNKYTPDQLLDVYYFYLWGIVLLKVLL